MGLLGLGGGVAAGLGSKDDLEENDLPLIGKASADVSRFLPKDWGAWLQADAGISTQAARRDLHKAGIATARVLDECKVISIVLEDELNKTAAQLK